jgi:NTP pyrophosphatase (non-canonical NTP hydrolase)
MSLLLGSTNGAIGQDPDRLVQGDELLRRLEGREQLVPLRAHLAEEALEPGCSVAQDLALENADHVGDLLVDVVGQARLARGRSGEAYAQVADAEDPRQRAIFEALMSNAYAPDIMYGCYYAGDYTRLQ